MQHAKEANSLKAIGNDIPLCLCRQVYKYSPERPKLKFIRETREYYLICPTCRYKTLPDMNKQSTFAEWHLSNRTGDKHIQEMWLKRYAEIQQL
jgi:hypothetical protein